MPPIVPVRAPLNLPDLLRGGGGGERVGADLTAMTDEPQADAGTINDGK